MADSHAVFGTEPNCCRQFAFNPRSKKRITQRRRVRRDTAQPLRVMRGGSVTVNGGPDMRILRSALRSEDERWSRDTRESSPSTCDGEVDRPGISTGETEGPLPFHAPPSAVASRNARHLPIASRWGG